MNPWLADGIARCAVATSMVALDTCYVLRMVRARYSRARRYHWRLVQLGLLECLQGGELVRGARFPACGSRECI